MRSEPRLKKKTDISVAPDELVESTGTCIGDKGVVFIELAAREHGSGYSNVELFWGPFSCSCRFFFFPLLRTTPTRAVCYALRTGSPMLPGC